MAHTHSVYDTDKHFSIDPATRQLVNETPDAVSVMQYDHNSERISFDLPAVIEGHNILDCNQIQVHYMNIDAKTKESTAGFFWVQDLQEIPSEPGKVTCSWLISQYATQRVGPLYFRITFECVVDGKVEYRWSTSIYKGLSVEEGLLATEPDGDFSNAVKGRVLLWENPDPTAEYGASSFALPELHDFEGFEVVYKSYGSVLASTGYIRINPDPNTSTTFSVLGARVNDSDGVLELATRQASLLPSAGGSLMRFPRCALVRSTAGGSTFSESTRHCVPMYIYGVDRK